jgi:hypothetical protein
LAHALQRSVVVGIEMEVALLGLAIRHAVDARVASRRSAQSLRERYGSPELFSPQPASQDNAPRHTKATRIMRNAEADRRASGVAA